MSYGNVATSEVAHEIAPNGAFVRQDNYFKTPFGDEDGKLPVEAGRYRLIWTPHSSMQTMLFIGLFYFILGKEFEKANINHSGNIKAGMQIVGWIVYI